ncbi:MAG TPA: sigma-70 family RNA polymerase sigma factor, partial [Gemmataceae bacterium]|nr:sigma-70 family RNA polymerase sigma factor [Gemmataceae bacterium]
MAEVRPNPVIQHIRHLIGSVQAAAMTDGQLLERFLASRDESAVEALVRRYGPLVLGVCRRVLHNAHAAEDAFQATFLVLMRKAPSLDRGKPLGSWLYTVAYRLALRARANEARRRQCETQAAQSRTVSEGHPTSPSDMVVALEEELQKLPEKHRAPLVLCYLQGKTNEKAAELLGCPRGSMSARLAQSRERLRACLARRGYAVPSAGIATLLATATAEAAVPLPLLSNTMRAAVWFAGEEAGTAGFVSAQAVALARGAVRAMFVNKLKIAGVVLLATAMLGTGATMLLKAAPQTAPSAQVVDQRPPEARPDRPEVRDERLPSGVLARMGTTRLRHGGAVFFAAYTPDGKALVTADRQRTVRLWALATGKELRRFEWGDGQPDSKPEASQDGIPQRFEQQLLDDMALSSEAALSADGKTVAASRGGLVSLWEMASGKKLRRLQTGQKRLAHLAFSADGKSLLTLGLGGRGIAVWDVATGKCVRRSQGAPAASSRNGYSVTIKDQTALVSPGLKYLAFLRRDDEGHRWIRVRDVATGKELPRIDAGPFGASQPLSFSADDKTLVWDHFPAGGIVLSDVTTGKELRRLGYHRRPDGDGPYNAAMAIAVSADGKSVAVCRWSHTIELWDLSSGKRIYPVGKPTDAQPLQRFTDEVGTMVRPALAFSPDGKKLVSSLGGTTVRQFQVDTGKEIPGPGYGHRAPVSTLALSADGKSLWTYSAGDPVRVWDWATGKETRQLEVPASAPHAVFAGEGPFGFAVGNQLTFCGAGGKKTWTIAAADSPLECLALSPDGAVLATRMFGNPEVRLWDAKGNQRGTLEQAGDPPKGESTFDVKATGVVTPELVFSPDGRCLAGAGPSMQLCLWDVATGKRLWELPLHTGQAIERFAFSPNGHFLASVNEDHTVTLYDAVTGAKRGRLGEPDLKTGRVHLAQIYAGQWRLSQTRRDAPVCLAFSPDGRYLATAKDR